MRRLPTDSAPLALLADHDAGARRLHADVLRAAAYVVEEADDGRQALAKALTVHPDVVVTETRLPGINGFELSRRCGVRSATGRFSTSRAILAA